MAEGARPLRAPLALSAALHAAALAAFLTLRAPEPPPRPPTYRVNLVAAPPGPRAVGVVQPELAKPAPAAEPVAKTPPRPVTERPPEPTAPTKNAAPVKRAEPKRSTPTPAEPKRAAANASKGETKRGATSTPAPRAGGGPQGGRGADVANVRTEGIEFPFPGYLENVVRQIALRFTPPRGSSLRAEVMFLIHRDGTISNLRFTQSSGSYAFDLEARGAVEKAARERAFGGLPAGFQDDVLPVIFSFDPSLLR